MKFTLQRALLMTGIVCLAALAFALFAQHMWNMQPCPWCILQRIAFILLAATCLLGASCRVPAARGFALLGALLAAAGAGIALYQSQVASKQLSCNLTAADKFINATGLNDLWPEVFAVRATCADASAHKLLGIPFEVASGFALLVLCLWLTYLLLRRWRRYP
jgi:protein dithiol:quinone oxidoreductase